MEETEVKELYSVSLSTVQSNNGISWSEDHKVSLISSTGLHVLEVAPNSNAASGEMCLKKSIIKPCNYAPTSEAGIDISRLVYKLDQRNTYRLILDMKLAPHLPDAKTPEPRFMCAQWSPASMYQDHRCMVATLTCTGCLKLHVPHFNCWVEVVDLSRYWVQYCKKQWPNKINETDTGEMFEILQNRTSLLKLTGMVWGQFLIKSEKKRYSVMATISHSGTLTLWKLEHLIDLGLPAQDYKPYILTFCKTDMYNACSLHWIQWNKQEISIVVGDTNGCVKIITFLFNDLDDTVSLQYIHDVWKEKDQMQVGNIKSFSHSSLQEKGGRILGVTKNSYFLVFLVTQREVMSYCHEHIGGLPITGLEVLNSGTFIACTLSGVICKYEINLEHSAQSIKLSVTSKFLKSNLPIQDLACFGIAKNVNHDVWSLCTNLCKTYDHLVVRRPSQIVFFIINDFEDSCKKQINELPMKIGASKLRLNWESLEIFRMNYVKQLKTQGSKDLELEQDLETLPTTQLQMELWRARIFVTHLITNDAVVRNPEACAYITLLEELILCRHACKYICTLVERHKIHPLEEKSLSAVGLLRLWLQIWLSQNKIANCGSDKNNEPGRVVNDSSNVSNSTVKEVANKSEMDRLENTQSSSTSCSLNESVADVNENIGDNDCASVGSLDDAISTDSNSSSIVSEKAVICKKLQNQQGRVPASFLKVKLTATFEQVTNVLALPVISGSLDKELCAFCDQEVQMDMDWRSGTCPSNHRLSRCCHCLSRCHQMPYRLCAICPAVACIDIDCDLEPYCTFCDSPLIMDEKFKKPGFPSSPEGREEEMRIDDKKTGEQLINVGKKNVEELHEVKQEENIEDTVLIENENSSEVSMGVEG